MARPTPAGTSQPERDAPALQPAFAPLDDRSVAQLLHAAQALAPLLRHYAQSDAVTSGTWQPFLPPGEAAALQALVAHADGRLPAHWALLIAFYRLAQRGQARLNGFTAAHLQHQLQAVLGFAPRPPVPDRAHLVLGLRKGAAAVEVNATHLFSAGKDSLKVDQCYRPVRPVVLGPGQVLTLSMLARDGRQLRFAPRADSADGLGAPLPPQAPGWAPFLPEGRPLASLGFALQSPVLRLAEGRRSIQVTLMLAGVQAAHRSLLGASLQAHCTGPKGWLGPLPVAAQWQGDTCTLTLTLGPEQAAVVNHDPALHLQPFPPGSPVLQLLLRPEGPLGPVDLQTLGVRSVRVAVQALGLRTLALENDQGSLDAKKAFLPFGSQPTVGSRFHVGCAEAFDKRLTALTLHLQWQGAPGDLHAWYAGYTRQADVAQGLKASLAWAGAGGEGPATAALTVLPANGSAVTLDATAGTSSFAATAPAFSLLPFLASGSALAFKHGQAWALAQPLWHPQPPPQPALPPVAGALTLTLTNDLLHADYPRDAAARALGTVAPRALQPPYTPKAAALTLDYSAQTDDTPLHTATAEAFAAGEVQFFQIDAFGLRREHAWLHSLRPWGGEAGAGLVCPHPAAAEFFVGLVGLQGGDAFSLLFQVLEGSADPASPAQSLQWSVLAGDAWHALGPAQGLLDTTDHLRRSGLLAGVLPAVASTDHTLLPAAQVWLRATLAAAPAAACRVLGVHANAVEVMFEDQGNDPLRLARGLPAGSLAKLLTAVNGVKTVAQPYASFGGALQESAAALARRAAERLRHRGRALTPWDVERLVLQAFPNVWRVRCLAHASPASEQAAGHLLLVVLPRTTPGTTPGTIPDSTPGSAAQALTPRVDLATLEAIRRFVQARCAPQAVVHVSNPRFEAVQLQFKLRLRAGTPFGLQRQVLNEALLRHLSPWAYAAGDHASEPGFQGEVTRSELLTFVEAQPGVDFVTDFVLRKLPDAQDAPRVRAQAPDAILVSAAQHLITELPHD